jgi:hypothetical protein
MKTIVNSGLCLAVLTAVSLIAVASSSATLPEFKSANGFPVTFTSSSLLPLEPVLKSQILGKEENIVCKMASEKGEITGFKTFSKIKVTYTECKEQTEPTKTCTTVGQATGTIVTDEISSEIGYVGTAAELVNKLVGTKLKPTTSGANFAAFTCTGKAEKVTVKGCTVGVATPTNSTITTGILAFEEIGGTNAKSQRFKGFADTETSCTLESTAGFFELGKGPSWLMDTETVTFSNAMELKA